MKQWKEKIIRYAVRNRKSPEENRRRVGKSLSLLAVVLFAVFLVNFAVIIGTGSKFGKDFGSRGQKGSPNNQDDSCKTRDYIRS